jgi:hypothetical protein
MNSLTSVKRKTQLMTHSNSRPAEHGPAFFPSLLLAVPSPLPSLSFALPDSRKKQKSQSKEQKTKETRTPCLTT